MLAKLSSHRASRVVENGLVPFFEPVVDIRSLTGASVTSIIPPPPSSNRPPFTFTDSFPLILGEEQNDPVRHLVANVLNIASEAVRGHRRAIPLMVGQNWMEMASFLVAIASALKFSQKEIHVDMGRNPLYDDEIQRRHYRVAVIANGDRMSQGLQMAYVDQKLPHIRVFLAMVQSDARLLSARLQWAPQFYRATTRTFKWPNWQDRVHAHDAILHAMLERLGTAHGAALELDGTARAALGRMNFPGTDAVYSLLKNGVDRFRNDPDHPECITATHLLGPAVHALSSSRRTSDAPMA